jgi:hypothetical protein
LKVISESKEQDNDLKDYIKAIVEEVLEEAYLDDEGTTSPEAKKIYSLLKKYGYKSFGQKNTSYLSFDKVWSVPDDPLYATSHRVYVKKYSGDWESGRQKDLELENTTGSGKDLSKLEDILKQVDTYVRSIEKSK